MAVSDVLSALGGMLLQRCDDGRFQPRGRVPAWCHALRKVDLRCDGPFVAEDAFPVLSVFLPDAERAWNARERADSDLWTEVDANGNEIHLEATAVSVDDERFLLIMRNERFFIDQQNLLQRARELRMTHASLMKEIEQKDVLVHAIVHDLAAPLHSMIGVLSLLGEQSLGEPAAKWIDLALQAATRQRGMIVEILDIFAAEGSALTPRAVDGIEVTALLSAVLAEREPAARRRNVKLERGPMPEAPCRVLAEETRLTRVVTNLLENAFSHGPSGGVVRLAARCEDTAVVVEVEDEGPGVPPDVLPRLFERFAHGPGGGAGLGLYFCRITVENWGGGIGYERTNAGGARFWIRLKHMTGERERT